MLRYILDDNETTTLEDELRFLEKYCLLQQLRFQDKLRFELDCEARLASFPIPKLLLQPLVENAIIHGVEPMNKSCLVKVQAILCEDQYLKKRIEIRVLDDGAGFHPDGSASSGTNIGLTNVRERMRMAFPESTFDIYSNGGRGTVVTMVIPYGGD